MWSSDRKEDIMNLDVPFFVSIINNERKSSGFFLNKDEEKFFTLIFLNKSNGNGNFELTYDFSIDNLNYIEKNKFSLLAANTGATPIGNKNYYDIFKVPVNKIPDIYDHSNIEENIKSKNEWIKTVTNNQKRHWESFR